MSMGCTQESNTSGLTTNAVEISTIQESSCAPTHVVSNPTQDSQEELVAKKKRKCMLCRKFGHAKNSGKLRQGTFRNSLDMTRELGPNQGNDSSDGILI